MALDMVDPAGRLQERRSKLARREEGQDGREFSQVSQRASCPYLLGGFAFTSLNPAQRRLFTITLQSLIGLFTREYPNSD